MNIDLDITISGNVSEEYIQASMEVLGELIIQNIRKNIDRMDLIETGQLKQQWVSSYQNGILRIESPNEYATYLEFGSYEMWQNFGLEGYPEIPIKKKNLTRELAKKYPKGVSPFAFTRRVIYNPIIMEELVSIAFQSQI